MRNSSAFRLLCYGIPAIHSAVLEAIWGVRITFSSENNGSSEEGEPFLNTAITPPAALP